MSIFQIDFLLLPKFALEQRRGRIPPKLSDSGYKRAQAKAGSWTPSDLPARLSELLPEFPSWSPNLRWWGTEEGDRIDVESFGETPRVRVRLDARHINIVFMSRLVKLAADWKCLFLSDENDELIRPTLAALLRHVTESKTLANVSRLLWGGPDGSKKAAVPKVFICHSSRDKLFVSRLAHDLESENIPVWYAKWVLRPGDSLTERIQQGIEGSGWFVVVLSENSIRSSWVKRELDAGLALELSRKRVYVVPVRIDSCQAPLFLQDKVYADFRKSYKDGFETLLRRFTSN